MEADTGAIIIDARDITIQERCLLQFVSNSATLARGLHG
jgi:hypothetical protein